MQHNDLKLDDIKERIVTPKERSDAKNESSKNRSAFVLMAITAGIFLLIAILVSFDTPLPDPPPPPKVDSLTIIEIDIPEELNFGNDENGGMGKLEPLRMSAPAPEDADDKPQSKSVDDANPPNPITDDNQTDAPIVRKVKNPKPSNGNTSGENPTPATTPTPQQPKNVFKGGNGQGGNNANSNNDVSQQGNGLGSGNQGSRNGSPYGNGTKKVLSKADLINRNSIENLLNTSGTNYKGTITLKVAVDREGNVVGENSITASPSNAAGNAAIRFVRNNVMNRLKFSKGDGNRVANIILPFDY